MTPLQKTAEIILETKGLLENYKGRTNKSLTSIKGRAVDDILTTHSNHFVTELVR